MKKFLFLFLTCCATGAFAQDDLMNMLNKDDKKTVDYATATFKSTRVINGQSVETMRKKHLDFRISHRFGRLNSGAGEFFGLDQATMRMGFEYGITDDFMIGVGRSTTSKVYDFFGKAKLLKQSSGAQNMPVSVVAFGSATVTTIVSIPGVQEYNNNMERMVYCGQLLIARKFNDAFSLQLTPTFIHRNRVGSADKNDIIALGIGGRYKISKRTSLNAEYFYVPDGYLDATKYYNSLSVGFDIETGGHVFQVHFTNSLGMIENQFIAQTTGTWGKGDVHYGFNISRTFSLGKKTDKPKW
ncbi:MAG: DUF5777 family beta-barrel protein [Spirosomataceae bacterium]